MAENLSIEEIIQKVNGSAGLLEQFRPLLKKSLTSQDKDRRDEYINEALPSLLTACVQSFELIRDLAIVVQQRSKPDF